MTKRLVLARVLKGVALGLAATLTTIVLVAVASNLFQPGDNAVIGLGSWSWTVLGPHFVLVSLIALVIALLFSKRGRSPISVVIASFSLISLGSSAMIVTRITVGVQNMGGRINPIKALSISIQRQVPDAIESLTYVDGRSLDAYVYKPKGNPKGAPVMLFIHGGGWISGSVQDFLDARWYTDHGWLVVSADYRLAAVGNPAWDKAPADVGCALSWTWLNAGQYGGDPKRLTVFGMSAGGNLALNLGWSAAIGRATTTCPALGKVPTPQAVIADYPVANPQYTYQYGRKSTVQDPRDFIGLYLGGSPSQFPERMIAISSSEYISDRAPDTLILEPERDDFVPAQGVYLVVDQARAAGMKITLARIPYACHAFDGIPGSLGDQATLSISSSFLGRLGLTSSLGN